jgi:hypothetical protein
MLVDQIKTKLELEVIGNFETQIQSCSEMEDFEKPTISLIEHLCKLVLPNHRLTLTDKRTEVPPTRSELKMQEMTKRLVQTILKRTNDITQEKTLIADERSKAL